MKKSEIFDYLVIKELDLETAFSNVKRKQIEIKIEKLINKKGTYEYNLLELYTLYSEEEDESIKKDLRDRILKLIPNDYDIKSDIIFYSMSSPVVKIRELEELEKECLEHVKKELDIEEIDNFYSFIEGREYVRLLDKIACLYLDLNKKEEYIKICEKILELNPTDSLSILDSLSLMYFNKKEYSKIQSLYSKHEFNLILKSLNYVINFHEGKDVKNDILDLLKRNHYLVYYFSNYLDIRQKALDRLPHFNTFPYGSLQETMLALIDIEDILDNEALELYMKAFLSYKGREIFDFLSEDEINAMCIIVSESNREEQDPTKEKIYKVFEEQHKKALLEERKYIPNNDRKYLENMLDVMVEKHLIEIDGVRVSLSLGGMMHMYTLMKKDDDYEEENFDEDESLYS